MSQASKQSSVYRQRGPSAATNGNIYGGVFHPTSTVEEANPWWEVDLGKPLPVHNVVVWLRPNLPQLNLVCLASDRPFPDRAATPAELLELCAGIATVRYDVPFRGPTHLTGAPVLWCLSDDYGGTVRVQYLRVVALGTCRLQLSEVQVFSPVTALSEGQVSKDTLSSSSSSLSSGAGAHVGVGGDASAYASDGAGAGAGAGGIGGHQPPPPSAGRFALPAPLDVPQLQHMNVPSTLGPAPDKPSTHEPVREPADTDTLCISSRGVLSSDGSNSIVLCESENHLFTIATGTPAGGTDASSVAGSVTGSVTGRSAPPSPRPPPRRRAVVSQTTNAGVLGCDPYNSNSRAMDYGWLAPNTSGIVRLVFNSLTSSRWSACTPDEPFTVSVRLDVRSFMLPCSVPAVFRTVMDVMNGPPSSIPRSSVPFVCASAGGIASVEVPISTLLNPWLQVSVVIATDGASPGAPKTSVLLPTLFDASLGICRLPMSDGRGQVVDVATASYAVVLPFRHKHNNLAHVWRTYWKKRGMLRIGHRGVGRSFKQQRGYRKAALMENTLVSFATAGKMGAEYIEFDALLTADKVPVIYHDFELEVQLAEQLAATMEAFKLGVHQLRWRALNRVRKHHLREGNKQSALAQLIRKHMARLKSGDRALLTGWSSTSPPSSRPSSPGSQSSGSSAAGGAGAGAGCVGGRYVESSAGMGGTAMKRPSSADSVDDASSDAADLSSVGVGDSDHSSSKGSAHAGARAGARAASSGDGDGDGDDGGDAVPVAPRPPPAPLAAAQAALASAAESEAAAVAMAVALGPGVLPAAGSRPPRSATRLIAALYSIPTLQALFVAVPAPVGFDIEIKYPVASKDVHLLPTSPLFDLNTYLDTILSVVFDHAGSRRVVFTCFHPEIVVALRAKQARYPVLFLTEGGTNRVPYPDLRCQSLAAAINHAVAEGLQGVVASSDSLVAQPGEVARAQENQLLVFGWGEANNDLEVVKQQASMGVDAVIVDNVGDVAKERPSFFQ